MNLKTKEHQGIAKTIVKYRTDSSSEPPEETNSDNSWILDFQPLKPWKNKFLLFWATQFVVIGYNSPRKWINSVGGEVYAN